ncbi:hypothetical protein OAT84_04230 [Gammaproteobacteria bacterium]|nr:hypothetical protein [Gammaproteobacteria bacterium]
MRLSWKKKFDESCVSQSKLWEIIQSFYIQQGHKAWSDLVPYTITNMRSTAHAHAQTILEQVNSEVIHIVDYGAGLGQHGLFLAQSIKALNPKQNFKIILADLSPKTISFWQQHPLLKELIDIGTIVPIQLSGNINTDTDLLEKRFQPHVYLFNYLLDSLPFQAVSHGYIQHLRLSTSTRYLDSQSFDGPLNQIQLQFICSGKEVEHCYKLNKTHYSIPLSAISLLQSIFNQPNCQLAIINDKGPLNVEEIDPDHNFHLDLEGCYSTQVNFPLLYTALPDTLFKHSFGQSNAPIKTSIISKSPLREVTLLCPEIAALIAHYKQYPIESNDHAIAICKLLKYDPFCLEIISQATGLIASTALNDSITACLKNQFSTSSFTLLHTARIYRNLKQDDLSLLYLNQFSDKHAQHPALQLEYGLYYFTRDPKLAKCYLEKAATDPKLLATARRLLLQLETVNG